MKNNEDKNVKNTFDKIWKETSNYEYKKSILYKIYNSIFGKFNSTRFLYKVIKSELKNPYEDNVILEPGCGTGKIAELINNKLKSSQDLLDISLEALKITKRNINNNKESQNVNFILGSMFDIPSEIKKYDMIWNEGVLEHFSKKKQVEALNEFSRVLKDNGKIVIIIPNKNSVPYMHGMNYAVKNDLWEFDYEKPEYSIRNIVDETENLQLIKEYSRGFISQFGFYRYYFKKNKFSQMLFLILFSFIQLILYPLNRFPGYYLIAIIKKIEVKN